MTWLTLINVFVFSGPRQNVEIHLQISSRVHLNVFLSFSLHSYFKIPAMLAAFFLDDMIKLQLQCSSSLSLLENNPKDAVNAFKFL